MEIFTEINELFQRTFSLVKYNLVLTLPFLLFWLILGFVMLPLTSGGAGRGIFFTLILIVGLIAAFMSGWMNMFKKCIETSVDENLPDDKRTTDSFWLFKEFFPGVGKNFVNIALGILIFFFLFNIFMLILEAIIMPFLGHFESFTHQEMLNAMENSDKTVQFWHSISDSDKSRIFKIAGIEIISTFIFAYLTMFWAQLAALKEIYPIKAFIESIKIVIKDPCKTSLIFFPCFFLILAVFFIGAILILNPIIKLLMILLFVYALIFYVMMTFLYIERYKNTAQTNIITE